MSKRKFSHNELWLSEHIIDGMIYSNDLDKWVTVEEYTDVYYGTLQKIQYNYENSWIIILNNNYDKHYKISWR